MLSKTSCFNATLFRKNLTTYWPLWAVYGLIWLLILPVSQFTLFFGQNKLIEETFFARMNRLWNTVEIATEGTMVAMAVVAGLLFAMALFSYLHNARAVSMMHSFPIKRSGLYVTNYLTGVVVFVVTHLVVAGLSLAVQVAAGTVDVGVTVSWFVATTCTMLFFYSFAVFCAMFTGQILAVPVYYGILNAVVYIINSMLNVLVSNFMYGLGSSFNIATVTDWLTPVIKIGRDVQYTATWDAVNQVNTEFHLENLRVSVIYGAVGIVLALWGFWVYSKRPSETAGDAVAIYWAKPIFRFGVALCTGLVMGQGLYLMLWVSFFGASMVGAVVCMVMLGIVGTVAAEMILCKSFKVLRQSIPTAVMASVLLMALGCAVEFDLLGVEDNVPSQDQVGNVFFWMGGYQSINQWTDNPQITAQVIALHQQVIDEQEAQENWEWTDDTQTSIGFDVRYYDEKEKEVMHRDYQIYIDQEDLNDPTSLVSKLQTLMSDPDVVEYELFGDVEEIARVLGGELRQYNELTGDTDSVYLTTQEAESLYQAVQADMMAGHVFTNNLFWEDHDRSTYYNQLRLEVTRIYHDASSQGDTLQISLRKDMTYTLAVLEDLGYTSTLISQANYNALFD